MSNALRIAQQALDEQGYVIVGMPGEPPIGTIIRTEFQGEPAGLVVVIGYATKDEFFQQLNKYADQELKKAVLKRLNDHHCYVRVVAE